MATDILTPDSYINEINEWVDKIYLITEEDYVHGGEDGYDNVPHQQLTNRTVYLKTAIENTAQSLSNLEVSLNEHVQSNLIDFSSLRANVATLESKISNIEEALDIDDEKDESEFEIINEKIQQIFNILDSKEFNYAASDSDGGDALTVRTQKANNSQLNIVGVNNSEPNKIKYNTNIIIDQNTISAGVFKGDLTGEAEKAKKLSNKSTIYLTGDIEGSGEFDGSSNVRINANIVTKENIPSAGTFGPDDNMEINPGDTFKVPQFTVDRSGVLTKVDNRNITLNLDPELISKTINVSPTNEKIYLVGTPEQSEKQYTYSNLNVYEKNGKLYSNNKEVVDVESIQNLNNKTINGYVIKEAASRNVDNTVGGTDGSTDLVTSHALYNHTHNYAPSTEDGAAEKIKIEDATQPGYLIQNESENTIATTKIKVDNDSIELESVKAKKLSASDEMIIPGGKIWLEEASGGGHQSYTPEIEALISEVRELKQKLANLDTDTVHTAQLNPEQIEDCHPMSVLSYQKDKYWLADNKTSVLTQNLALSLDSPTPEGNVDVLTFGTYNLPDDTLNGSPCYVGTNGEVLFEQPKLQDAVSKKIGFVVEDKLIFRPEDSNTDYVVAIENSTWEKDVDGNIQPVYSSTAHDALWEQDTYGDYMPAKYSYSNEIWATNDKYELFPIGDGSYVPPTPGPGPSPEPEPEGPDIVAIKIEVPQNGVMSISTTADWSHEIRYTVSTDINGEISSWDSPFNELWSEENDYFWVEDNVVEDLYNNKDKSNAWNEDTVEYDYPFNVKQNAQILVFMEMPAGLDVKDYLKITLTTDSDVIVLFGE